MSSKIRVDKHGRIRSKVTGRFLGLPEDVHRIRVSDGVVFVFDKPEPKGEIPQGKGKWGEFK